MARRRGRDLTHWPGVVLGAGGATPVRRPTRKKPDHPERREQKRIVGFLTSIGGKVWELGTTRKKGDHMGTMQSPGLPDLIAFMKRPAAGGVGVISDPHPLEPHRRQLVVEVKINGNTMTTEQRNYRQMCLDAGVDHVVGDLNDVIAWLVQCGYVLEKNLPHYRIPGFQVRG